MRRALFPWRLDIRRVATSITDRVSCAVAKSRVSYKLPKR